MRAAVTLVILLPPAMALCGDAATLDFIGFSAEGGYFAYSESGIQDGSGFPYCSIRALDAVTAQVVWSTDVVFDDYWCSSGNVERAAMREAKAHLFALGIQPSNTGFHAVHHPLSDLGVSPDSVEFTTQNGPEPWGGSFRVVLQTRQVPDSAMLADWGFEPSIVGAGLECVPDGGRLDLPVEALRPGHEMYTWGYRIQDVFILDCDLVVVIIEAFSLGFEGANVRFLSACGRLSQLEK